MAKPSIVLTCAIIGIVAAEIYMLFTVFAPHLHGEVVPLSGRIREVAVLAIFFGPFGAAVGTGVGLLLQGAADWWRKPRE